MINIVEYMLQISQINAFSESITFIINIILFIGLFNKSVSCQGIAMLITMC